MAPFPWATVRFKAFGRTAWATLIPIESRLVTEAARVIPKAPHRGRILALVSAAMEAVESSHAETLPDADLEAPFGALPGALDPARLSPGPRVSLYHPQLPIGWVEGTDLVTGGSRWRSGPV